VKRMKYPHSISDYEHVSLKKMMKSHKATSKRKYCISVVVHLNDGYSYTVAEKFFKEKLEGVLIDHLVISETTDSYYEKKKEYPFPIRLGNNRYNSDEIVSIDTLLHDVKKNRLIDVDYRDYYPI